MPGRLDGKIALITGGGGGIGSRIGKLFAGEGARVALSDIDGDAAAEAVRAIEAEHPGQAVSFRHDVTSEADWKDALRQTETAFGGLNVLVNNAGIAPAASIEDTDPELWRRVMDINLDSVYLGCRLALPLLRANAPASIVNISSISGLIAGHNLAAYNASKAAVWMLTKSVALHAAREGGVRVNSVHPAFIETGMLRALLGGEGGLSEEEREKFARQVPLKRIGRAEDVAWACVYLAAEESAFMTGAEIKLDGGLSAG